MTNLSNCQESERFSLPSWVSGSDSIYAICHHHGMSVVRPRRTTNEEALARVVEGARKCFAARGVPRTRMDDVAEAAGMARQNVYRYVSGREELVELAVIERLREFQEQLLADLDESTGDLPSAFIDHILRSVRIGRGDREFLYLTDALPRVELNLLVGSPEVREIVRDSFEPLIRRARTEGALRTDASEDEMIEWLQGVLTLLTPRTDLDEAALRRIVEKFTLPVLLKQPE
jgi:AcrR family transcriptional regulator